MHVVFINSNVCILNVVEFLLQKSQKATTTTTSYKRKFFFRISADIQEK